MELSTLKICNALTWTTSIPERNNRKVSDYFRFQNSNWSLFFQGELLIGSCKYYALYLSKKNKEATVQPFRVTCFVRGKNGEESHRQVNEYTSGLAIQEIWKLSKCSISSNSGIDFLIIFDSEETFNLELKTKSDDTKMNLDADLYSLSSKLGKLLASGDAADVQLQCRDATRPAHKSILAARSEVFSAMFRNKMKESIEGVIDISFIDADLLEKFLEYMYTGKLSDFPSLKFLDIYSLADKYAVHSLKKQCCDWAMENLSEDNYQSFLEIADCHSDEQLKDSIINVITANPEWLNCEMWLQFSKEHPMLANEVYHALYCKTYFKKPDCVQTVEGTDDTSLFSSCVLCYI